MKTQIGWSFFAVCFLLGAIVSMIPYIGVLMPLEQFPIMLVLTAKAGLHWVIGAAVVVLTLVHLLK